MTTSSIGEFSGIAYGVGKSANAKNTVNPVDELMGSFQSAMDLFQNQNGSAGNENDFSKDVVSSGLTTAKYEYHSQKNNILQTKESMDSFSGKSNSSKDITKADDSTKVSDSKENKSVDKKDTKSLNNSEKAEKTETSEKSDKESTVEEKKTEMDDQIVSYIADKLDVSEEDVISAMETLGLQAADLANEANMGQLVTELTADGDVSAMLTDENMFSEIVAMSDDVNALVQTTVEDLASELNMDVATIEELMAKASDGEKHVVDSTVLNTSNMMEVDVKESHVTIEVRNDVIDSENENAKVSKVTDEAVSGDTTTMDEAFGDANEELAGQNQNLMNDENAQPMFSQVNAQMTEVNAVTGEAEVVESYTSGNVDTKDIIDQIVKHIRVNNGPSVSEMEMALTPANLGNVHIQVSVEAGVVTARIAAESEAVRDALAVQAMLLKEELNEQGLKVESVEVTVASHEFEQNMQGNSGEEARQLYEENLHKQTRQRMILSSLEEAEELLADPNLSDAERLQVDMMAKSGSSMDIKA